MIGAEIRWGGWLIEHAYYVCHRRITIPGKRYVKFQCGHHSPPPERIAPATIPGSIVLGVVPMTSLFTTTATSADRLVRDAGTAVLPVGSFEQHGAHLPLMTDTLIACEIANRIAVTYELFLLPPITISCSHEHAGFPGTVSIRAVTLAVIIDDICQSLSRSDITSLVLVSGHGGNYVLANVVLEHNVAAPTMTLFPTKEDWNTARTHAGMETTGHDDMHGGELETSILLHTHPDLVGDTDIFDDHEADDRRHLLINRMPGYTSTGIIGRPSLAAPAKGSTALDSLTQSFADHLKELTSSRR